MIKTISFAIYLIGMLSVEFSIDKYKYFLV